MQHVRGTAVPINVALFEDARFVLRGPFVCGQGAQPCAIGGVLKESALMWAARQGFMAVISELLDVSGSIRHTECIR